MIKIQIDGIGDLKRRLAGLEKQVPFALSRALNTVAFGVMREGRRHLEQKLDRPTPWTIKSWYVRKKASKRDLMAVVGWSDFLSQKRSVGAGDANAEYYLSQHWTGGGRKHKAFERQLIRAGVLPRGMFAVPGEAADQLGMIDRFGNMKGGVLVAILSGLGALDELGYSANATVRQSKRLGANKSAAKKIYWAGKPGVHTPNGIWMLDDRYKRGRGRLRPIMVFVRAPRYKKILDLDAITRTVRQRDMPAAIDEAVKYAIRTAR